MTPDEHRALAAHNEAFFKGIDSVKWPGWVITGVFYTALHEVQAFLQEHGRDPRNHPDRNDVLTAHFPNVATPYARLSGLSTQARYHGKASKERINESKLLLVRVRAELDSVA